MRELVRGLARNARSSIVDLWNQCLGPVVGLRNRAGVERVGFNDVRASLQIGAMDPGNDLRFRQHQNVIVTLEIAAMRSEALTAEGSLVQLMLLDHGAHGTIEQYDTLLQRALQTLDAFAALGLINRRYPKWHRC